MDHRRHQTGKNQESDQPRTGRNRQLFSEQHEKNSEYRRNNDVPKENRQAGRDGLGPEGGERKFAQKIGPVFPVKTAYLFGKKRDQKAADSQPEQKRPLTFAAFDPGVKPANVCRQSRSLNRPLGEKRPDHIFRAEPVAILASGGETFGKLRTAFAGKLRLLTKRRQRRVIADIMFQTIDQLSRLRGVVLREGLADFVHPLVRLGNSLARL